MTMLLSLSLYLSGDILGYFFKEEEECAARKWTRLTPTWIKERRA